MRCVLRTYRTYRVEVICWYGVKPISCFYSKGGTYPNSYTVSPELYSHPGTCEDVTIKIELKNLYALDAWAQMVCEPASPIPPIRDWG